MTSLLDVLYKVVGRALELFADGVLVVTTPLVEKNPAKLLATRAPIVLSMARVVVLCFAAAMLHQVWVAGVAGWPESTLCIAVVLAVPIVSALERVSPADVLDLADMIVNRFGEGAVRPVGDVYRRPSAEPSKYDDHRSDSVDELAASVGTNEVPSTEVVA
jgi:hypothetical protein